MNSHFQSSDTTSTSTAFDADGIGFLGSSSCEPNQAMPPRKVTTTAGIAQTISSNVPENAQFGRYFARLFEARNHQAKANVARMTGTTITNMIVKESKRISRSETPTGPRGSSTPLHPVRRSASIAAASEVLLG